ncbi:hypothetical protein GCM10009000_108980 [Halobacterium noricense]
MRTFDLAQNNSEFVADELARSDIRKESVLESILHANPQAILDEPVFIFGRQTQVDTGILDLLALDQYGNLLIIELKVGQSGSGSASEETILSQPQNYAQSLESYTYDRLDDIYQDYREDIKSGKWAVSDSAVPANDLQSSFEAVFGEPLEPDEFNLDQRMVIIAEDITKQTHSNARYLLERGLNFQCVEVQKFETGIDHLILATNMVLDYELSRIRPEGTTNPTYPEVATNLSGRIIPKLQSEIGINVSSKAFKEIDSYRPHIAADSLDQPAGIKYTLYLRPAKWESVLVAIDYMGEDKEVLTTIRDQADHFEKRGFTVSQTRSRDRIVRMDWETDSTDVLSDNAFLEEVANEFVNLVKTGHEVFTDNGR